MKGSKPPWFVWLAIGLVWGFVACIGLFGWWAERPPSKLQVALALILLAVGMFFVIVGLIRFVKWAWEDED